MSEEVTKDMIGCLCWFWVDNEQEKILGILSQILEDYDLPYRHKDGFLGYKHCRPVKSDEIKLFRDADDMLNNYVGLCKIGELKAKIKELEKENLTLRYALKGKDCEKI